MELAQLSVREAVEEQGESSEACYPIWESWLSDVACYLMWESSIVFINKTFEISWFSKTPKCLLMVVLVLALLS